MLLTQLCGVSKLLHSLPANAPTKRMHAAKLVFHRCPRHAQISRHNLLRSASRLATLYGHSTTYSLIVDRSRTLLDKLRICSLCSLLSLHQDLRRPNTTNQTPVPSVGTRLLRRILKRVASKKKKRPL